MVERRKRINDAQVSDEPMTANESGAKVTVACKLPGGLVLHLDSMEKHNEPIRGEIVQARKQPTTYTLKGWYDNARSAFGAEVPIPSQIGQYALTHGIPEEFWNQWLEHNKDSDIVKNRLIFASSKRDIVEGMRKDNKGQKSGLEPIDPKAPPRDVRRITEMTKDEDAS